MQAWIVHRLSRTGSTGSSNFNAGRLSMDHLTHRYSPRRYRPKLTSNQETSKPVVQWPTVYETPVAQVRKRQWPWPSWLEELLSVVHYNFPKGRVFFCVSCNKGLYQEKHFVEGADHHWHDRLRMYDCKNSLCVNKADIESLGVNTAEIQEFTWSVEGAESTLFMFMHVMVGYSYDDDTPGWRNCAHCNIKLQYAQPWPAGSSVTYCSLDCKVKNFRNPVVMKYGPLFPVPMKSPRRTPPPGFESGSSSKSGAKSVDESGDIYLHSADPSSVEQSPNAAREVDQIGLPEVLFEDQLHVLLSPCEEILSSMRDITTPPASPTTSREDPFSAKLHSCADSNPVESSNQWRWHTTAAITEIEDEVVDGERMENARENVEPGLGLTPKSLDDCHILRKAGYLLRSFGSEFENNYRIKDDSENTSVNSIQASSSPEGSPGPKFSMACPEVVSYKIHGSIDFRSLKQLAATFDPQRWISEARCPDVVSFKLPPAAAPVEL